MRPLGCPALSPALRPGPSPARARDRRAGLSRREEFRRTRTAVLDATRRCGGGNTVVMTVVAPITWAEVQTAFDEIHEKQHLAGIRLHFDRDGGRLRAIFEPVEPRPADLQPSVVPLR